MQNNREQQFVELVQEHSGIMHKLIRLYVDTQEDQKDLYQEILLQSWKSFPNFKGKSKFSTWLYRISLNTILTFNRNQKKDPSISTLPSVASSESAPHEKKELLYEAIKKLHEIDRMIITLHLESYKNAEIAEITGMKTNHINVKLHRIKHQIISQLKKAEDGLT